MTTPSATPDEVAMIGALQPSLFLLPDVPSMNTLIQFAIDGALAWMEDKLGANLGIDQFPWQVTQQKNGLIALTMERLARTLQARKVYGTHFPYMSEDSAQYSGLDADAWQQAAKECLDRWVTVETIGPTVAFALPVFVLSAPIPETDGANSGLTPLDTFYDGLLSRARGGSAADIQTVTR